VPAAAGDGGAAAFLRGPASFANVIPMPGTITSDVTRPAVPMVKRGDLGQSKALGDGRHGGIDDAKRKIKISFHKFGHAADAGALESGALEPVTAE